MITMGLRAAPKVITFAIYDSKEERVLNVEDLLIPAAFLHSQALKYIRSNILDILRIYDVCKAGIRTTEPIAKSISLERVHIEGVIQETFASSNMSGYFSGPISTVCYYLGVSRNTFKPMVKDGNNDFDIGNWGTMSEAKREAVLCAIGAANA